MILYGRRVQLLICAAALPSSRLPTPETESGTSSPSVGGDTQTQVQRSDAGNTAYARSVEPHDTATFPCVANTELPPSQKICESSEAAGLIQKDNPVRRPFDPIRDLNPSCA